MLSLFTTNKMLLLLLILSLLSFQSDKKLYLLVLVKNQIFLCHTFLATYKRLSFVTFSSIFLLANDNRVQFNAPIHKYISFVETSLESVSYIFCICSILQMFIYAFSKVNFKKKQFVFMF